LQAAREIDMARQRMLRWLLVVLACLAAGVARADEALWSLLQKGGQVVMIRHGLTDSGVGDPPAFRLGDCATQRNLSEEGRNEARRLGEALRSRKVPVAAVQSSAWCRCMETAQLVFGRSADAQPALANLFGRSERQAQQVTLLRQLVHDVPEGGNLFLVTHGSTTLALTGVSPATAEMVVLTPQEGGFKVAGRLKVP
jgi:phosphohistidine phosphatase SixA